MAKKKLPPYNDNNFAIAYYRYSSHAQRDVSIEQQQQACQEYARTHGYTIIKEYADRHMSGTDENRPQLNLMLSEVGKLKPAALIMWKTDRLGRDTMINVIAKNKIREAGCRLHLVMEAMPEGDGADAVLLSAMYDGFAAYYSAQLRENIIRGQKYNAEHCLYHGHKIIGFKGMANHPYEIDADTAPIVQRIFTEYATGTPLKTIMAELNDDGLKTSTGGAFNLNGLRHILHNDAYIGVYRFGEYVQEGGMPAIVTKEIFDMAQKRMARNKRTGGQRAYGVNEEEAPRFWLTGKLFCGECGCTMQGSSGKGRSGRKYYYYACLNQRKHKCSKKPVTKDYIEDLVISILRELLLDDQNIALLAAEAIEYYQSEYKDSYYLDSLESELKETERKLKNIMAAIEQGIIMATTQDRINELESQEEMLEQAIAVEKTKMSMLQDDKTIRDFFEQYRHSDFDDTAVRDELFDFFIERIYLSDDRIKYVGRFYNNTNDDFVSEHEFSLEDLNDEDYADIVDMPGDCDEMRDVSSSSSERPSP